MTTQLKSIAMLCLYCYTTVAVAQSKLTLSTGISNHLSASNDSLFFAKKQGLNLQLNAAHYWGRLGLGIKAGYNKHSNTNTLTPPNIPIDARTNDVTGNGTQSTYVLIGPELCLCYRKLKLMPTIKLGIASTSADSSAIGIRAFNGQARQYKATIASQSSFAYNVGTILAYKVHQHVGIGLTIDYISHKVKHTLSDYRSAAAKLLTQPRRVLNTNLGIYFTF